jgi:GNAT superfamily N-acetyltransferase
MRGVVAEAEGHDGLIGMGLVDLGECQFEGDLYPCAYLNSLSVHPDFRRRGVATRLAQWRVDIARDYFSQQGKDGIIYAGIQGGNTGSISTAAKWSTQRLDEHNQAGVAKVRSKRPEPVEGLRVRRATPADLEEIAEKQNDFYRDYNFYPPQTAADLHEWLSLTAFGERFRAYCVAVDSQGNIVAGLGVTALGYLMSDHIVRLPTPLKIANLILQIVPRDGVARRLSITRFWFSPGMERAGVFLWESARWLLRKHGTMLMIFFDPRSTLRTAIVLPRLAPRQGGSIVLSAPVAARHESLVYFNPS